MRTNCDTFSFKDCCFLLQKDREGASRVNFYLIFRLLYGNSSESPIVTHSKFHFVVLILESINTDTLILQIIEKWLRDSVIQFMISLNLSKLRLLKHYQIWNKIFWNSKNMMMLTVEVDLMMMIKSNQKLENKILNHRKVKIKL